MRMKILSRQTVNHHGDMLIYKEGRRIIDNSDRYQRLNMLINLLLANTIIIFIIGALAYGERFRFWDYAYSYLGMTKTPGGHGNTFSLLIYVTGCLFNSIFCFNISNTLTGNLYRLLFKFCGLGYLLLMLPCNLIDSVHSVGGALVFGSFWFFSIFSISNIYRSGKKYKALIYSLLLNATVLPYAFMYIVKSPDMQIAQKPAILGVILVLKLIGTEYSVGQGKTGNYSDDGQDQ